MVRKVSLRSLPEVTDGLVVLMSVDENDADAVHIYLRVVTQAVPHFRRHITGCAALRVDFLIRGLEDVCNPEIANFPNYFPLCLVQLEERFC